MLNMPAFLETMNAYLSDKCHILSDTFEENLLTFSNDHVAYRDLQASTIILCTGYKAKKSLYFGWIPIAPVKGEIIHVKSEKEFKTIYNKSGFIIPQDNGLYKAGSTYDHHDMSEEQTEHGKNEITKKLDSLLKMNFKVVKHEAGIRPATVARRPLIGRHPRFQRMYIFNGMGTKGVSLAPFFGDQFVGVLTGFFHFGNFVGHDVAAVPQRFQFLANAGARIITLFEPFQVGAVPPGLQGILYGRIVVPNPLDIEHSGP